MEKQNERRSFIKFLLSLLAFGVTSILSFRFKKDEGFKIGKIIDSLGAPEASGTCGFAVNCAGGGGQCGFAVNCAGGQGDTAPSSPYPGGGGKCGFVVNCAGGGGKCGFAVNCAGS